ncbi:MAG: family 10 glycosylhydrolase [SAR202 cluster bacterium]|nr:family 10 glycosylhydrolase [SAR202 cluster bacterium]
MILWGPPVVPSGPLDQKFRDDIEEWIQKCANVGVNRIIGGDRTRVLTEVAGIHGIDVHPYVNFNSFPRHGSARESYGWSLAFLRPPVTAPGSRQILDKHRPIYDDPKIDTSMTDFARAHPEFRSLTRDQSYMLQPGQDLYLSLAFPEVRAEQTQQFIDVLEETDGSGVQVEFVLGNEDQNGVVPYGYEHAVTSEFQRQHGKNPFEISNDDPDWIQFRADYTTRYLLELKDAIKAKRPNAVFSATLIAGEPGDYMKLLHDWPAWVEQGAIDELFFWFRTNSDLGDLANQMKHASEVVDGRCRVIAELSCYHPGSFQDPDLMIEAGRVAVKNGADAVGIYRTHAVEQLDFWHVLESFGKL